MWKLLAPLGLLLICSQVGPAQAAVTYSTTGQLAGITAQGNTVAYTVPSGHVLKLSRVTIKALDVWSDTAYGTQRKGSSGSAYINSFAVATFNSRSAQMTSNGTSGIAALGLDSLVSDGRLDLEIAGPQTVSFSVDTGFVASWIGTLHHPPDEYPLDVVTPVPVTTPEPTPSPTPTPTSAPSSPSSSSPSSDPSIGPTDSGAYGLTPSQAEGLLFQVDKMANLALMFSLGFVGIRLVTRVL